MDNAGTMPIRGRTAAQRKRDQRPRQEIQRAEGKPTLTAKNMTAALLDAMSLMLHDGRMSWRVEAILLHVGFMLADSKNSSAEIRRRLMRRLPKVWKEQ